VNRRRVVPNKYRRLVSRSAGSERKRCAGTATFEHFTEFDPVPWSPATCQSSSRSTSETGTAKSPASSRFSSSSKTSAPSKSQWAAAFPEANGQKPLSMKLPVGFADGLAARADHGSDSLDVARRVDLLLNLIAHMTDDVIVRVVDAEDPSRRRAAFRDCGHGIDMGAHRKLRPAPFLGPENAKQTRVLQKPDVLDWHSTFIFGLEGAGR